MYDNNLNGMFSFMVDCYLRRIIIRVNFKNPEITMV